jgi:uncharacterized membrane protein required for colicin V production
MGLDLTLAAFVLLAALRGWFKGFMLQAVRLVGLVACVYEAGPVRDFTRPYVEESLRGIRPDLLDRLLWWCACIVSYVVTVGLATWMIRLYRRRPYGEPDMYRGDQSAGLILGGAKGLLMAAFLVAGLERYALVHLQKIGGWAQEQADMSYALDWSRQYRPAARFWAAPPVQNFVAQVQRMGIRPPDSTEESTPVQTASRPKPALEITNLHPPDSQPPLETDDDLKAAVDAIRGELEGQR